MAMLACDREHPFDISRRRRTGWRRYSWGNRSPCFLEKCSEACSGGHESSRVRGASVAKSMDFIAGHVDRVASRDGKPLQPSRAEAGDLQRPFYDVERLLIYVLVRRNTRAGRNNRLQHAVMPIGFCWCQNPLHVACQDDYPPAFSATAPLNGFLHVDLPRCNDRFLLSIDCHRLSNVWKGTRTVYLLVFQQPARGPL